MGGESNGKSESVTQPRVEEIEANPSSLREGNASFLATVFNGVNCILGNGVLLVPYALASGGWLSLVLLFVVSMAAAYSGVLIRRCMEVDPRIKSYSNIGEYAFGRIGQVVVSIILFADLYMADTGFLILEGDNLHKLFPGVAIRLFGIEIDGKSTFIIIVSLILLPTVWLDNLSVLAYISASGVLASLLILAAVTWVGAFDGIGFHHKGELLNWKGIPTAISLFMLCYSSNPVFPSLYTSMKKKHHFSKVILLCFLIVSTIYISMAILGYLMFGSGVESQITLNLPTKKISSQVAIYTTFIAPLTKYALLLKPVVISVESWFPMKYQKMKLFKIIVRTALVATQTLIALTLPFFGVLMSLTGALLSSTGTLTVPCLCYLKMLSKGSTKISIIERIIVWVIVIFSVLIVIFGTYTSLSHLVKEFSH